MKKKTSKSNLRKNIIFITLLMSVTGLVILADVSAPQAQTNFSDKYYFVKQQGISWLIGMVGLVITSSLNYKYWEKIALSLFAITTISLIAVLIPGIGTSLLGARRWIFLGSFSFQPSELAKFALLIYFAKVSSADKQIFSYLVPLLLFGGLIMLQPDLGTTLIVMTIGFAQLFVSNVNILHILYSGLAGGVASLMLVIFSDYRRARLMTFLQQTQDPLGRGYHIRQILLALGSGGAFGVGFGQSRQKYLFLPESATDSIFAIVAEEFGFVGATVLIAMFAYFVFVGLRIASRAPDTFSKSLAIGVVAWVGGQAFLNMGAMTALIPLTGIPLPFFSYGGSALIMILTAVGILISIAKQVDYGKTRT